MKGLRIWAVLALLGPSAFPQLTPDLVIINADVRTMSDRSPRARALAITGNKISLVGSNAAVLGTSLDPSRVIDAKGGLVIPGFNDPHVHFMAIGNRFSTLDLRGINEPVGLYERLREYARFLPKGRWILGSGGGDGLWERIDGAEIDRLTPDNPVFLYHADARSAVGNSKAHVAAGIGAERAGVVRAANFERIRHAVPADHTRRWAEIAEAASNYAAAYGITSVQDTDSDDRSAIYLELGSAGRLKTRIYDCIKIYDWKKHSTTAKKLSRGTAWVRAGCLKGTADVDGTALQALRTNVLAADKAGLQVLLHAIGARQIAIALNLFEEAIRMNGKRDRRFRIEHAERAAADDISRMRTLGVIASVQPYLFVGLNANREYYGRLASAGIPVIFGSDAPMTEFDPFLTLRAASGGAEGGTTVWEAVRRMTSAPAWAEFQEASKGRIEVGMLADIVVLGPEKAGTGAAFGQVRFTIVDGKVVYRAD